MQPSIRHTALVVPDLRAAEGYYRRVFDMELIGREAELADGQWYSLPLDKGWDEATLHRVRPYRRSPGAARADRCDRL